MKTPKITADIIVTGSDSWPLETLRSLDPSLYQEIAKAGLAEVKIYHGILASDDSKNRWGFEKGHPLRTSYVVREEGDLIFTRNSVYRRVTES
jgi:hypothetical protein